MLGEKKRKVSGSTSVSVREKQIGEAGKSRFTADARSHQLPGSRQGMCLALLREVGRWPGYTHHSCTWVRIKDPRERVSWLAPLLYVTHSDMETGSRRQGKQEAFSVRSWLSPPGRWHREGEPAPSQHSASVTWGGEERESAVYVGLTIFIEEPIRI